MPIALKCGCGKQLNVKDELAGKAIKCPGCASVIRIPAGGGASVGKPQAAAQAQPRQPQSRPAPSPAAAMPAAASRSSLDDLFAEEGLDRQMNILCPACRKEMQPGAVLCLKCGFNIQTGERLEGHRVAGVDVDMGTLALEKAARDLAAAKKAQEDMIGRSGMPPWMLGLILFIFASAVGIAVLAVNASRRTEELAFKPLQMFMNLGGSAFLLVALGGLLSIIALAFRTSQKDGFLSLTVLYAFFFAIKRGQGTWKRAALVVVCGGISGFFFAMASRM